MTKQHGNSKAYEVITARIIEALEKGTVPWRQPWNVPEHGELRNAITSHRYRGINPIILSVSAATQGFTDPRWLTFKQARQKDACVRKGEKGTPVVFWNWIEKTDPETGEKTRIPFLRYYTVFNAAQIDDLEVEPLPDDDSGPAFDAIEAAEKIIAAMPNPPSIDHNGGTRAFYVPKADAVHLPATETFTSQAGYYSTKFHELGHSTGHKSRLDRKGIDGVTAFGSATYSKEELVAEFASAFLCGEVGIGDMRLDQSSAYIASWLRALKSDPKMAVMAAAQAQKAADYILGTSERKGAAPDAAPVVVALTPAREFKLRVAINEAGGAVGDFAINFDAKPIKRTIAVVPDLFNSFRKHFGADAMRRIPAVAEASAYAVKCDDCKREIKRTNDIHESYAGGRCDACKVPAETYEPTYMVPGKDHRKKPGKATFRGKGSATRCTSIAYWGVRPIAFTPPPEVMDALNGVTRAGQAIGRVLCGGDPPSNQLVRPAVLITAPHYAGRDGLIDYMGDTCPGERCRPCQSAAA